MNRAEESQGPPSLVDITPTWEGLVPLLLASYERGGPEGRRFAEEEFFRLARIADALNAVGTRDRQF